VLIFPVVLCRLLTFLWMLRCVLCCIRSWYCFSFFSCLYGWIPLLMMFGMIMFCQEIGLMMTGEVKRCTSFYCTLKVKFP
jgi:hypothetical protein